MQIETNNVNIIACTSLNSDCENDKDCVLIEIIRKLYFSYYKTSIETQNNFGKAVLANKNLIEIQS